jgi:hypothetical protein
MIPQRSTDSRPISGLPARYFGRLACSGRSMGNRRPLSSRGVVENAEPLEISHLFALFEHIRRPFTVNHRPRAGTPRSPRAATEVRAGGARRHAFPTPDGGASGHGASGAGRRPRKRRVARAMRSAETCRLAMPCCARVAGSLTAASAGHRLIFIEPSPAEVCGTPHFGEPECPRWERTGEIGRVPAGTGVRVRRGRSRGCERLREPRR